LNKIKVVKAEEVECEDFVLDDFLEKQWIQERKIGKKELKVLADSLGVSYTPKMLSFSKKLLRAYIKETR